MTPSSGLPHGDVGHGREDSSRRKDESSRRHPPPQDQSLTSTIGHALGSSIVYVPFMILMLVFQIFWKTVVTIIGNPRELFSEFFLLNNEQNEVLRELPVEQGHQRHEVNHIQDEQITQKSRIADLQRRVAKLEERQRQREAATKR
jgi:hypothetical protein